MAAKESFDITTGVDLQEVDNAVNQAKKELTQRYDFKNVKFGIDLDRKDGKLTLSAPDTFKLEAVWSTLQGRLVRREVPLKNLSREKIQEASLGTVRQVVTLVQGIDSDLAREIVATIKKAKLKKVQAAIQDEQVRVTGPKRDDLQEVIALLKDKDFGVELKFGNYRSH